MNILNAFRISAWRRLIDTYGTRWYPRLGPQFFKARYIADGVMSRHDMASVVGPNPARNDYRFYLTKTFAQHAMKLEGLFVSLGVAQGDHALRILQEVKPHNPFWLVDSFDGRRSAADPSFKEGYVSDVMVIRDRFKAFSNVHILQGLVPQVLGKLPDGPIAWGHFNLTDPDSEIPAIEMLGPRLVRGGVVIVDNFGRASSSDEQRRGYLRAAEKIGLAMLVLPTGHGVIFG